MVSQRVLAVPFILAAVVMLGDQAGAVPTRPITIAAGEPVAVSGEGCVGGTTVEITLGAAHASGLVLASFPAGAAGKFIRSVVVPAVDQPTASLVATCTVPGGNTDIVYAADLTYRASGLALTGLKSLRTLVLAAFALIALGMVLMTIPSMNPDSDS